MTSGNEYPSEKVHTQFLECLIGVIRNTSIVLLMGDLGRLPLYKPTITVIT